MESLPRSFVIFFIALLLLALRKLLQFALILNFALVTTFCVSVRFGVSNILRRDTR